MKPWKNGGSTMMFHSEKELPNGFWDIEDLSNYLKVKVKTLYAIVPDIPHYRIGKLIRFRKEEIDSWMEGKRERAVQRNNSSRKRKIALPIDRLIKKAIDQAAHEVYNPPHGKSDLIKGPTKEIHNGSI